MANVVRQSINEDIITEIVAEGDQFEEVEESEQKRVDIGILHDKRENDTCKQLVSLIKDVNNKFSKEISNLREEFRSSVDIMLEEMKVRDTRLENELRMVKRAQEEDQKWVKERFRDLDEPPEGEEIDQRDVVGKSKE